MRRATTLAVSAVLLPGVLALAACSSSSTGKTGAAGSSGSAGSASAGSVAGTDNAGLTSAQLTKQINAALAQATSVSVKGSITQGGETVGTDVQLYKDGTGQGTITIGSGQIPFIAAGGVTYIQFTSGFATLASLDISQPPLSAMVGKWVPSTNSQIASVAADFTDNMTLSGFVSSEEKGGDIYAPDGTATLNGQSVARYKDTNNNQPPTVMELVLPAHGLCLPLQQVGTGTTGGTMTFTWNQPEATVTAPPANEIYSGS